MTESGNKRVEREEMEGAGRYIMVEKRPITRDSVYERALKHIQKGGDMGFLVFLLRQIPKYSRSWLHEN